MKLQFKHQPYQQEAVDAVVGVFEGQPKDAGVTYRIDPGRQRGKEQEHDAVVAESGRRNAEIQLSREMLLNNVRRVRRVSGIPHTDELVDSKAAPGAPNLDVEMETGTGKTYVYIKTIMELNRRYGWSKFIVVVPSIAIREGVKKTFDITAEHFAEEYGTAPRAFIYNSKQLHEVEHFSSQDGVRVMIINIQAFNSTSKDNRRIYDELDDFQSRRPIDVISANRPILIIDEPQKISGKAGKPSKSLQTLARFNPLAAIRYSATHVDEHTKVHRLDALDAYQKKLVKKIAVRGITVKGLAGASAYLYLDQIEVRRGGAPRARVEIEERGATSNRRKVRWLEKGDNLYELSGGLAAYKGLTVRDIRATDDTIELSNDDVVFAGQVTEDLADDAKRRIQIREVIAAHLEKERALFHKGIKVLSLFFVDEVAKYRDYSREDTLGDYARVFEEEYAAAVQDLLGELDVEPGMDAYKEYLQRDSASDVHQGYFSIDKKTQRLKDPDAAGRGEEAGQSRDPDAYDLILKNKERLLSREEPVRFIFSHSALREGWDNPNVFVMGMLKKSDSITTRRQEIGRGLRLAVDQNGERWDHPETVHQVNELTVVTDEAYTDFVRGLQKEISSSLAHRPRQAKPDFFMGKSLVDHNAGTSHQITEAEAKELEFWLIQNGLVDADRHLTDKWLERAEYDLTPMPAGLENFHYQVAELIDSLQAEIPAPVDGRKPKMLPTNENFERREFQELWSRINRRAVYQVNFDSAELVRQAVSKLDKELRVSGLQYVVEAGCQRADLDEEQLATGDSFDVTRRSTHAEAMSPSQVPYDLVGEIAQGAVLTRPTVVDVLRRIRPETFARYRQNPERFIAEAVRLLNEVKASVVLPSLTYELLSDRYGTEIFSSNQVKEDFSKASSKLEKHIYDYVVTDSKVEKRFAADLETSDEVAVYAKLPPGFSIPTPLGNYNPDWAIAFEEGSVKHVYFIAETKGSMSTLDLKGAEDGKIEAARTFFRKLAGEQEEPVVYDVVDDYGALMEAVQK